MLRATRTRLDRALRSMSVALSAARAGRTRVAISRRSSAAYAVGPNAAESSGSAITCGRQSRLKSRWTHATGDDQCRYARGQAGRAQQVAAVLKRRLDLLRPGRVRRGAGHVENGSSGGQVEAAMLTPRRDERVEGRVAAGDRAVEDADPRGRALRLGRSGRKPSGSTYEMRQRRESVITSARGVEVGEQVD